MTVRNQLFIGSPWNLILMFITAALVFSGATIPSFAAESACITCHADFTPELVESFQLDIHAGLTDCSGCHGGNPYVESDDMEGAHETDDFSPPPWKPEDSSNRCGTCHGDTVSELATGPHKSVTTDNPDADAPGCTSCHGSHPIYKIQNVNSPVRGANVPQTCGKCHADSDMMGRHDLPSDIPNKYRNSVHGRALLMRHNSDAASCVDCHDNHGTHNESVVSFDEACARCHQHEANAFKQSKHQRVWELTEVPVCITCHNSHEIESPTVVMLGTQEGAVCSKCHYAGDPPDEFRDLLSQLDKEYARGQVVLVKAQRANKNVSEELMILEEVRTQLEKAKASVHYFDLDLLRREVSKGLEISSRIFSTVEELVGESSCITCHSDLNPELVDAFNEDVHADNKISCHGCHGGNPLLQDEQSMSRREGFIGVPNRPADLGSFCASCHSDAEYMNTFAPGIATDQLSQFKLSGHGQALKRNPNDDNVAHCTDCHGTHGIKSVSDPLSPVYPSNVPETCNVCHGDRQLMIQYGIKVNPYEDYRESVHGNALLNKGDIAAPACNDCHGNHGAVPPGVDNIANVCGQCHALNASLFKESIHRGIWELRGMPQCGSCHGHHAIYPPSDNMLSTEPGSFCEMCHQNGGPPDQVRMILDSLEMEAVKAEDKLQLAESYLVSVDEGYFKLDKARSELTKMRVLLHRFDLDTLKTAELKTISLIEEVNHIGDQGIQNAKFRRNGFMFALILFALFVAVVVLKIRQLERQRREEEREGPA
jgi:predicted CXXCH cytochrome family protein